MDLHQLHMQAMEKGNTLLLGAAGSGIGFGLHETADKAFSTSLLVSAAAILCWCVSFAAGIFRSDNYENALRANVQLELGRELGATREQIQPVRDRFDHLNAKQSRWRQAQLWLLLAGAALYLAGQTWSIAERPRPGSSVATSAASLVRNSCVIAQLRCVTKRDAK